MRCPACGFYNRAGARVCRSCGDALPAHAAPPPRGSLKGGLSRSQRTVVSARGGVLSPRRVIGDYRRAGFFIRSVAMIIDCLFVVMLDVGLLLGTAVLIGKTTGIVDMILTSRGLEFLTALMPLVKSAAVIVAVVPPLYFIAMTTFFGQTIGKMIAGIRVVRSDGRPVSLPISTLRFLAYVPSGLLLFAGFLWIIWDDERQGWHDMISDTFVIRL
jgi:uncharacterized RDD family membrane protein YckC